MSYTFVISVVCLALAGLGCDRVGASVPTAPSVPPAVAPAPPPVPFPSIVVGEVVRFQFTAEFSSCVKAGGACRSYNVTAPSDGQRFYRLKVGLSNCKDRACGGPVQRESNPEIGAPALSE